MILKKLWLLLLWNWWVSPVYLPFHVFCPVLLLLLLLTILLSSGLGWQGGADILMISLCQPCGPCLCDTGNCQHSSYCIMPMAPPRKLPAADAQKYSQGGVIFIMYLCVDAFVEGGTSHQLSLLVQVVSMVWWHSPLGLHPSETMEEDTQALQDSCLCLYSFLLQLFGGVDILFYIYTPQLN